jgi:hypothetical protein
MQIENVVFSSLSHALKKDDRELFFSTVWKSVALDNHLVAETIYETRDAARIHQLLDKTALAYFRELRGKGTFRAVPRPYQPLADFVQRVCNAPNAVRFDTEVNHREITQNMAQSPEAADLRFMKTLSESLQSRILLTGDFENATLPTPSLVETVPALGAVHRHLGLITQTLKHRFPQLQVVEIGPNHLGPSRNILAALDGTSGSYVFGNMSPTSGAEGTLDQRVQEVKLESLQQDQLDKLREFSQEGFDLMVVSFLIHGRQNMNTIVSNLRGLIKPGGYILFVEPTRELTWLRYLLYGTLTAHDDQALGSPVHLLELENVLRSSMFSGVDHVAEYSGISVMISQALDNRIAALRHPLHPDHMEKLSGDLLFIGDGNLTTYRIIQDTVRLLHGWKGSLVVEQSLDTLGESRHNFSRNFSAVVILNDLNIPHPFDFINHHKHLEKIQNVLDWSKNILWVALDGDFNDPIHAATVAFSRSIANQIEDARFQSVLIENTWNVDRTLATSLVRLVYAQHWKLSKTTHLWTDEDEIKIRDHQMFVPRVLPAREPNNRFNASRRNIIEEASDSVKDVVIDIVDSIDSLDCYPWARSHALNIDKHPNTKVNVQVNYSSLMALRVGSHDYLHICIGQVPGQEGSVMALSETLSNSIMIDRLWQLPCEADESMQRRVIDMTTQYFSATWINSMFNTGTAVIYEPGKLLAFVLSELIRGTNKRFVFLTSDQDQVSGNGVGWTFIHSHSSRSAVQSLVPRDTNLFVNMGPAKNQTAQRIIEIVSPSCSVEKDALFRIQSRVASCASGTSFVNTLKLAHHFVSEIRKGFPEETGSLLDASRLIGRLPESTDPLAIVDWADVDKISMQARPLDTSTLISHNRTYLLANVCIAFANPLARWLVSGGARHIVIAGR